jgi:hypothetical protein
VRGHNVINESPRPETPDDILKRVHRDSETLGSSSMARVAGENKKSVGTRLQDHFSGQDAYEEGLGHDPAEVWGRRIGRALSLIGVIVLAYLLYVQMKL